MHHHIHAFGPSLSNSYSGRTLDKSEVARKAAEVRKRLGGASGEVEVEAEADGDMEWLVRPGYEAAGYGGRGRRASLAKLDAEVEETGTVSETISVWA